MVPGKEILLSMRGPCFENCFVWLIPVSFIQACALKYDSHTL